MKALGFALFIALQLPWRLNAESADSSASAHFINAKTHLENMLNGKEPMSYEEAIYQIENAWWEGQLSHEEYSAEISYHVNNVQSIIAARNTNNKFTADILNTAEQKKAAYEQALANYSIYSYMTDTVYSVRDGKMNIIIHQTPFTYSQTDPFGTNDWKHTQVTNLFQSRQGNCFALTSLYKILSERLGSDAKLCTAPNHIYISHKDDKGTPYNVELASRSFPGTGTIETITYTPDEAVKNGISLRELDLKQSIALCLVYLAKGYEYKFKAKDNEFMLACAETALKHDDHNLNALLLKAEVLENRLVEQSTDIKQLQNQKDFKEYQLWITHIYKMGYREMPFEMKNILIKGWTRDTIISLASIDHTPKSTNTKIQPTRYASLSWGLFDEDIRTKPLERFGNTVFDTKKQTIVAFLNSDILYNQYNFDPVVFAWNVDPLAHKMPGWSPYAAMANNPILNFDPDGAFPYSIHVRSFAPFKTFGGGFDGDGAKRGYSTAPGKGEGGSVTSRMQHAFTVDPTAHTFKAGNAWSDESSHPVLGKATAKTRANISGFRATRDNSGNSEVNFTTNMASANPLVSGSPDIDIHTKFTLRENENGGSLAIHVVQTGDAFPSAETFIGDAKGNQLFIGVSPAMGSPYTSLPGDGSEPMMTADFNVKIDKDGIFTGVQQGDKSYTPSEWNAAMQAKPTTK